MGIASAFGLAMTTAAFAVEVDPMRVERTIPLSEPTSGELAISNPSEKPITVKISAGPYRSFQPGLVIPSAESWLSFEPASFTLASGASTTVQYQVQPPAAIAQDIAGEYLAAILIDQLPAEAPAPATGSTVTIIPRLAIPVYLQIQGREKLAITIAGLKPSLYESEGPAEGEPPPPLLRIDTQLKNSGTVHARPVGTFALFDVGKNELWRAAPLGRTVPLLPSATLSVPTLLPLPPAGKYRLTLTLEAGMPEPLQKETSFEVTEDGAVNLETKSS